MIFTIFKTKTRPITLKSRPITLKPTQHGKGSERANEFLFMKGILKFWQKKCLKLAEI